MDGKVNKLMEAMVEIEMDVNKVTATLNFKAEG